MVGTPNVQEWWLAILLHIWEINGSILGRKKYLQFHHSLHAIGDKMP
jgi:hypothetical protein